MGYTASVNRRRSPRLLRLFRAPSLVVLSVLLGILVAAIAWGVAGWYGEFLLTPEDLLPREGTVVYVRLHGGVAVPLVDPFTGASAWPEILSLLPSEEVVRAEIEGENAGTVAILRVPSRGDIAEVLDHAGWRRRDDRTWMLQGTGSWMARFSGRHLIVASSLRLLTSLGRSPSLARSAPFQRLVSPQWQGGEGAKGIVVLSRKRAADLNVLPATALLFLPSGADVVAFAWAGEEGSRAWSWTIESDAVVGGEVAGEVLLSSLHEAEAPVVGVIGWDLRERASDLLQWAAAISSLPVEILEGWLRARFVDALQEGAGLLAPLSFLEQRSGVVISSRSGSVVLAWGGVPRRSPSSRERLMEFQRDVQSSVAPVELLELAVEPYPPFRYLRYGHPPLRRHSFPTITGVEIEGVEGREGKTLFTYAGRVHALGNDGDLLFSLLSSLGEGMTIPPISSSDHRGVLAVAITPSAHTALLESLPASAPLRRIEGVLGLHPDDGVFLVVQQGRGRARVTLRGISPSAKVSR